MLGLIATIVRGGALVSVFSLMLAQGMDTSLSQLRFFQYRPLLLLRSLFVTLFLVPLIALLVVALIRPERSVAVALAILAVCPAAPLLIMRSPRSGGNPAYSASLHVIMAAFSIVTTPVLLAILARALHFQAVVHPLPIAKQVAVTLLLPVLLGVLFGAKWPELAGRIRRPLVMTAGAVLGVIIVLILVRTISFLAQLDVRAYAAIILMIVLALALGHWLAPPHPEDRIILALETAARHPGLALLIASLNFPGENALAVVIPYLILFFVLSTIYTWLPGVRQRDSTG
ncbi:MAG TPA: bile acid:sodium symporter [Armatimonadota bacterium]|nr:bile acid:sodium symporter [Armatimonadota bacterium]